MDHIKIPNIDFNKELRKCDSMKDLVSKDC